MAATSRLTDDAVATQAAADQPSAATNIPLSHIKPDGIRDTIDSIIVALILAFVFRAFIVEAFVIPTGSMAPALYGMHGQHRCANCAYSFAFGIREPLPGGDRGTLFGERGERRSFPVRCPNCTWDGSGNLLNDDSQPVVPNSGDRILVLKWPYDIGGAFLGPRRWDVCVFKNPQDGEVNFIKRLLGLPGEVVQIVNGDLYAAAIRDVPSDIREALTRRIPDRRISTPLNAEQLLKLAEVMKIQRKTPVAQESLWMIHYDHDFIPRKTERDARSHFFNRPYWEERTDGAPPCWDVSTPRARFEPAGVSESRWIDLKGESIQDEYGYNNIGYSLGGSTPPRFVGDVRVSFVLFPVGSEGELVLMLSKGEGRFQARLFADGKVSLEKFNTSIRAGFWEEIQRGQVNRLTPGQSVEVEFENLDYRVALRINKEEVIATTDAQYKPDLQSLFQPAYEDGRNNEARVAIAARNLALEIRHLKVHRDVFYRSDRINENGPFDGSPGWGTAMNPVLLRDSPVDFFCCGDNSPQSKDSRLWTEFAPMLLNRKPPNEYQFGTVPGDQMIGRAFFVYWPSGLRFSKDTMAVIPNVGRMRLIR